MASTRRVTDPEVKTKRWYATGRRKSASARVYLSEGSGNITINGRDIDEYLRRPILRTMLEGPFGTLDKAGAFDVTAIVSGGGLTGQAGAIRHGIARALLAWDADTRALLKSAGFLTRDARVKERKKYGQRGARARFQFSKR